MGTRSQGTAKSRATKLVAPLLAVAVLGGAAYGVQAYMSGHRPGLALPTTVVHRGGFEIRLKAGGRVDSVKKTTIECKLENLSFSSGGRSLSAGGSSTILELVPEGTKVRKDDVLCRLDASDYEELVRQQEIKVQEARTDLNKARLDLQAALQRLTEFRDGLRIQQIDSYNGQIALIRADIERQRERVRWSQSMLSQGYMAPSRVQDDSLTLDRLQLNLSTTEGALQNYQRFGSRKAIRQFESQVYAARTVESYQMMRLTRMEERLKHFREQVESCTIRAPHDGLVLYANPQDRVERIEVGARVRQQQGLFYLPDMTSMEILTLVHESVLPRVRDGMRARVRLEALPNFELEGHVQGVAPLPEVRSNRTSPDVMNFIGHVRLNGTPEGLMPGMSAEVEIVTGDRNDVLVVPTEAITADDGREICYVAGEDGIERREVSVGECSESLVEVRGGLSEGERVVTDPRLVEADPELLAELRNTEHERADEPASQ